MALMIQAGLTDDPYTLSELKAYHINQRDEGIDLNGVSGALMATNNMQMQTFVTQSDTPDGVITPVAFAANQRDEVRDLHDVAGALGAQPGMKQQTYVAAPISMADDTQNAAVDVDMSGTLKVGGAPPLVALTLGAARECPPGHRRRSAPRCPSTSRASRAGG